MNKQLFISLVFCIFIIGAVVWLTSAKPNVDTNPQTAPPPIVTNDGVQIIDITAKSGYSPRTVTAKAGVPTTLRMLTNGTFDCSASLVIPKLSYQKFLQASGIEEIQISAEQAQGTLYGVCSMGMYSFKIIFQ